MGSIKPVQPVKLIIGEIFSDEKVLIDAENELIKNFSEIEFISETIPFDFTDYYEEEMGKNLKRRWISFKKTISPEELSEIKIKTNQIENSLADAISKKRKINLDPGYITCSNLILASTKNYSHRIYLSKGIFSEVTLIYQQGTFHPLQWTYPDYKIEIAIDFFKKVRKSLIDCLQKK
ncbi:MAG: DUF4416 family protein [Endomicrobiia bacterium]